MDSDDRSLEFQERMEVEIKKIMKSESNIIRWDLRNFLLQQWATPTGKVKGGRHGKANEEVIALVHTVGNEGVGADTDSVYRKEEMDVRETTEVE